MAQRKGVIQAQREREEPPIFKWVLSSEMATISGVFSGAAFHRTVERMNTYERRPYDSGEAEVEYLDGDFKVRRPGAYVRCAVTRRSSR